MCMVPFSLVLTDSAVELRSCTVGLDPHYRCEYWIDIIILDLSQKSFALIHLNFFVIHPPV